MFLLITLLCGCMSPSPSSNKVIENEKIKGVWIFYKELSMENENGGTEESFIKKIDKIFTNCKSFGVNTVFLQIRPFADSFYPSKLFPWSKYLTGEQGKSISYDPLAIMINLAHEKGLALHAWINPFRITFDKTTEKLSKNNPALKYINSSVITIQDNGIYFNPANLTSQALILDGIREIIENYNVDGIHIDDYFYPTVNENIDKYEYNAYRGSGGKMTLADWRKEQINAFVSSMYSTIKNINEKIMFSISPAGNIENNYTSLFADVRLWCSQDGYCDLIIPQLYFGFKHKTLPFEKALKDWMELKTNPRIKLIAGIGAYKAAEPQSEEWKNSDIVSKQVEKVLNTEQYDGYSLFSYSSLIKLSSNSVQEK